MLELRKSDLLKQNEPFKVKHEQIESANIDDEIKMNTIQETITLTERNRQFSFGVKPTKGSIEDKSTMITKSPMIQIEEIK